MFRLVKYIKPTEEATNDRIYDSMNMTTAAFVFIIEPGEESTGKVNLSVIEDSILRVLFYTLPKVMLSVCNIAVITKTIGGNVFDDQEERRKELRKEKNVARLDDDDLKNTYGSKGEKIWFQTSTEGYWTSSTHGVKKSWRIRECECKNRHQERIAMWIGDKKGKIANAVKTGEMFFSGDMRALLPYTKSIEDESIWK